MRWRLGRDCDQSTNASPYALQLWGDGSVRFTANWAVLLAVGQWFWNSSNKVPLANAARGRNV